MKLDKLFLTGCDIKTEWQLPWFLNNYLKIKVKYYYESGNQDELESINVYTKNR